MAISIWHLLPRMRARLRPVNRVERTAAECLAIIWPHVSANVKSMSANEAYGYLHAHATLHVARHVSEMRLRPVVLERVVQLLEERVHQRVAMPVLRRAA